MVLARYAFRLSSADPTSASSVTRVVEITFFALPYVLLERLPPLRYLSPLLSHVCFNRAVFIDEDHFAHNCCNDSMHMLFRFHSSETACQDTNTCQTQFVYATSDMKTKSKIVDTYSLLLPKHINSQILYTKRPVSCLCLSCFSFINT